MSQQKVEVEFVAKADGFFGMLAKGIRAVQDFAEKGKAGTAQANQASKEHLETMEKMEARVRSLTQQWMKLKAQQLGGDSSRGLAAQTKATERELRGASADLTRFKAGAGQGPAAETVGLEAGIARLKGFAMNAMAAYVGVEALKHGLKESVGGTLEWVKTSQAMGNALGTTTERASALKVAIGDVYATEEEFNTAISRLTQSLNKKEEAFTELGVATRDANGHLRPTVDILLDTNTALGQLKAGTDRNVVTQAIFGRGWMDLQKVLKLNNQVMKEAEEKAQRLGLIVGGDLVEATNRFRAAQNDADDTLEAMKIAVGQELLPVLTEFSEWAAEDGPKSLGVLSGAIKVVVSVWKTLVFIVQAGVLVIGAAFVELIQDATALGEILTKVMSGDFKGAKSAGDKWLRDLKANWGGAFDEIKARFEGLGLSLNLLWDPSLRPKASTAPRGGVKRGDTFKEDKEQDKEFEKLKAQLEREREGYENRKMAQGQYVEWSKAQDAGYWHEVLTRQDLSEKTRAKAQQEYFKARREVLKKANEEDIQLQESYRERDKAAALGELDDQLAATERARELRLISAREALDATIRIEQARYEVEKQFLNDRLRVANLEPAARSAINAQLEELDRQHKARMRGFTFQGQDLAQQGNGPAGGLRALDDLFAQAQNRFEQWRATVTDIVNGVGNVFSSTMNGILTGQIQGANILKSIYMGLGNVMASAISKIIGEKTKEWMVDRAISAWKTADSVKKQTEAVGETGANTASAASGIFKAHSSIPWVGVAIAIAMIALMMSTMQSITARAVGGRIDRPELALIGEAGPEIIAPERSFQDYTQGVFQMGAHLQTNMQRHQGAVAAYDAQAAGFARDARSLSPAPPQINLTFPGAQIWDRSDRGMEQFGNWAMDAIQTAARRRGQVLVPGNAGGSF